MLVFPLIFVWFCYIFYCRSCTSLMRLFACLTDMSPLQVCHFGQLHIQSILHLLNTYIYASHFCCTFLSFFLPWTNFRILATLFWSLWQLYYCYMWQMAFGHPTIYLFLLTYLSTYFMWCRKDRVGAGVTVLSKATGDGTAEARVIPQCPASEWGLSDWLSHGQTSACY